MDEAGYRAYLKKKGKQPHVIDGLVQQVQDFAAYLQRQGLDDLAKADERDIQVYAEELEQEKKGSSRTRLRGVALYYRFLGNPELANTAGSLREAGIAQNRNAFSLDKFLWVDASHLARLHQAGMRNSEQLLCAGRTAAARQQLAEQTGVPLEAILELVMLSDLARIPGLKNVRARLYYNAGVHTPQEIASWEAEPLRLMLEDFVRRTNFPGIPPLPKEVQSTIASARDLEQVVEYS